MNRAASTNALPRQQAINISANEWEKYRKLIIRLYSLEYENRTFNEVQHILANKYQFYINKRQFDRRVAQWGIVKNWTLPEMRALVCIWNKRKAMGKRRTAFRIRRNNLDEAEVRRYFARRKISDLNSIDFDPRSMPNPPLDVGCFTPPPDVADDESSDNFGNGEASKSSLSNDGPRTKDPKGRNKRRIGLHPERSSSPDSTWNIDSQVEMVQRNHVVPFQYSWSPEFQDPEIYFGHITDFCRGFSIGGLPGGIQSMPKDFLNPRKWRSALVEVSHLHLKNQMEQASIQYGQVRASVDPLVRSRNPEFMAAIISLVGDWQGNDLRGPLTDVLDYVSERAKAQLGRSNPITAIIEILLRSDGDRVRSLGVGGLKKILDYLRRYDDRERTSAALRTLRYLSNTAGHCEFYEDAIIYAQQSLLVDVKDHGFRSPEACWGLLRLSRLLFLNRDIAVADDTVDDALDRFRYFKDKRLSANLQMRLLKTKGSILDSQGHPFRALVPFQEAVNIGDMVFGTGAFETIDAVDELNKFCARNAAPSQETFVLPGAPWMYT